MNFLNDLDALLAQRKETLPEGSYTSSLFKGGIDRILRKVGEEAGEVIIAGKNKDTHEIINETADLLFHCMVHLKAQGLSISDVVKVLQDRHSS